MINATLTNKEKVIGRLRAIADRSRDLSVPLNRAGVIVRNAAIMRIKQQGGDQQWQPNKRGGHTGIDTGRMMQSLGISQSDPRSVTIGTNVKYARWFQEGTGIFAGHSQWTIVPKNKKALAFSAGGSNFVRRKVTIPGQPPRPFLLITTREREKIVTTFRRWIMSGV